MEYSFTDLQSRESILGILQNRRLQIHNVDALTIEELFRIYKNFATPLSRRHKKYRNGNKQDASIEFKQGSIIKSMLVDNDDTVTMLRKRCTCTRPVIDKASPVNEASNWLEDDYQYQLNTATKRIKILP